MQKLRYIGPHDAVAVEVAPRRMAVVGRYEVADFGDAMAERLLEQVDNWEPEEGRTSEVPEGTIDEVMAWVGDSPDRAQRAVEAEETSGKPRTKLLKALAGVSQED